MGRGSNTQKSLEGRKESDSRETFIHSWADAIKLKNPLKQLCLCKNEKGGLTLSGIRVIRGGGVLTFSAIAMMMQDLSF